MGRVHIERASRKWSGTVSRRSPATHAPRAMWTPSPVTTDFCSRSMHQNSTHGIPCFKVDPHATSLPPFEYDTVQKCLSFVSISALYRMRPNDTNKWIQGDSLWKNKRKNNVRIMFHFWENRVWKSVFKHTRTCIILDWTPAKINGRTLFYVREKSEMWNKICSENALSPRKINLKIRHTLVPGWSLTLMEKLFSLASFAGIRHLREKRWVPEITEHPVYVFFNTTRWTEIQKLHLVFRSSTFLRNTILLIIRRCSTF